MMALSTTNTKVDPSSTLDELAKTVLNKTVLQRLAHAAECQFIAHEVYEHVRTYSLNILSNLCSVLSQHIEACCGKTLKEEYVVDYFRSVGIEVNLEMNANAPSKCQLSCLVSKQPREHHQSQSRQPRGSVAQAIIKKLQSKQSTTFIFLSKTSFTALIRTLLANLLHVKSLRLEAGAILHIQLYIEDVIQSLFSDALLIAGVVPRATVTAKDMSIVLTLHNKYSRAFQSSAKSVLLSTMRGAAHPPSFSISEFNSVSPEGLS